MLIQKLLHYITGFILTPMLVFLGVACSEQDSQPEEGHVWQEQTEALDRARAVEDIILDSAEQQQQDIEQQTQ